MGKLALHALPKRALTAVVGAFSMRPASRYVIPWYIRHYQIDMSEAELPLHEYTCLRDLFCRRLKSGMREIGWRGLISPVDGTVSEFGTIRSGQLLQAKGDPYSLAALLGDEVAAHKFEHGCYITLYLSPRDYHRIHMPVAGTVKGWRYIPGALFPVNRHGVRAIRGLFTKNERLVTFIETPHGDIAMIKVGATIVGSIRTDYGPTYERPGTRHRGAVIEGDAQINFERGAEVGHFELGSTVILLLEKGMVESFAVQLGQSIRMGALLATLYE